MDRGTTLLSRQGRTFPSPHPSRSQGTSPKQLRCYHLVQAGTGRPALSSALSPLPPSHTPTHGMVSWNSSASWFPNPTTTILALGCALGDTTAMGDGPSTDVGSPAAWGPAGAGSLPCPGDRDEARSIFTGSSCPEHKFLQMCGFRMLSMPWGALLIPSAA